MLSVGRKCLKGHRMELYIIELWTLLCWLVPIALELVVRRLIPATVWWHTATLCGSFLLNRLLLSPAHAGYYTCCQRLAAGCRQNIAATCEIADLHTAVPAATLLRGFFREYRHPLQALKRQLRWDAVRLLGYTLAGLPGLLLIAFGGLEQSSLLQALLGGSGLLFGAVGLLLGWILFRRLQAALYCRPSVAYAGLKQTRRMTGALLRRYARCLPLLCVPLSLQRFVLHTEIAMLLKRHPVPARKKAHSQIFHTRVLRET